MADHDYHHRTATLQRFRASATRLAHTIERVLLGPASVWQHCCRLG